MKCLVILMERHLETFNLTSIKATVANEWRLNHIFLQLYK